ncbi:MAG: beta-ketoacyl synthase N-terminal-like domain-containing protein [Pseudomonadota bacterium]
MKTVYVNGAAAVSGFGFDWRGLGHADMMLCEAPPIGADIDVDARARKLMSHPARLAAVALRLALNDAAWPQQGREDIGLYLGVGASGCSMEELTRMLAESIEQHEFSLERFGTAGLAACNPLFAFQLMNNFTLCHGAILNGPGGPNGAFYSRGTGTLAALAEAHWLIGSGECERVLAGGADSALHQVTMAQLVREGFVGRGLVAGEGAGLLALSSAPHGALATLDQVRWSGKRIDGLLSGVASGDLIVLAPWGTEARAALLELAEGRAAAIVDLSATLGEALAAAPALAWCAALDLLQAGQHRRAHVVSAGIDGGIGLAVLGRLQ